MRLMPQEEITSSALSGLMITNKRIRYTNESAQTCWSMYLKEIVSISLQCRANNAWYIFAIFSAILSVGAYLQFQSIEFTLIFFVGIILGIAMYRFSRSYSFTTSTVSTKHSIRVSGGSLSTALVVIELIEHNRGE